MHNEQLDNVILIGKPGKGKSFKKSMSYEELTTMTEKIKEEQIIEDAYINTVIELGNDEVK